MKLITEIPAAIWSAIIAAIIAPIITLGGVFLTNRNYRITEEIRFKHASVEHERDRQMSLKRDIYIPALDGASRTVRVLALMMDLENTNVTINQEMQDAFYKVTKLNVVASNDLFQAAYSLLSKFIEAFSSLWTQRARLLQLKGQLDTSRTSIDKIDQDQQQVIAYLRQLALGGNPPNDSITFFTNTYKSNQTARDNLINIQQALQSKISTEWLPFLTDCVEKIDDVSSLVPLVILSARRELELPIDEKQFLAKLEEYKEGSKRTVYKLLDMAKKEHDKQSQSSKVSTANGGERHS